jgi:hypothetical protein
MRWGPGMVDAMAWCQAVIRQLRNTGVRFEIPTAVKVKVTAFRDVASCSLVDGYRHSKQPAASSD